MVDSAVRACAMLDESRTRNITLRFVWFELIWVVWFLKEREKWNAYNECYQSLCWRMLRLAWRCLDVESSSTFQLALLVVWLLIILSLVVKFNTQFRNGKLTECEFRLKTKAFDTPNTIWTTNKTKQKNEKTNDIVILIDWRLATI